MGKRKGKAKPPKIIVPKKKDLAKTLSGKIRKYKEDAANRLATSAVDTFKTLLEQGTLMLGVYTHDQAAVVLGVERPIFSQLIEKGIVPKGEVTPCGGMYYYPNHIKLLTIARARYIYIDNRGYTCVKREPMKAFLHKYWPQEVYNERKGKWSRRQTGNGNSNGVLPNDRRA